MKATLLYATFAMVLGAPAAFSKSELETLRDRCAEQESQIRRLEEENSRLKGNKEAPKSTSTASNPAASTAKESAKAGSYTVSSGDTLERISRKTGVSVAQLGKLNKLKTTTIIHPGLVLKLPAKASVSNAASRTVTTPAPKQEKPAAKAPEPTPASRTISNPAPANKTVSTPTNKAASTPAPQPTTQAKAERPAEPAAKTPTATGGGAKPVIRSVIIQDETNYGAFATLHGTTADRLNELNGLSLSTSTVLAKGSELYIPAQP